MFRRDRLKDLYYHVYSRYMYLSERIDLVTRVDLAIVKLLKFLWLKLFKLKALFAERRVSNYNFSSCKAS